MTQKMGKESDHYETPSWIKSMFFNYFDPCPLKASFDGLAMENWGSRNFVNPPYSNPLPWVKKAVEENKKGHKVYLLLKLDCSTEWYRRLVEADAHFLFINERVKFSEKAPPFPNVLVVLE